MLFDRFEHFFEACVGRNWADRYEESDENIYFALLLRRKLSFVRFQVEKTREDKRQERACKGTLEIDKLSQVGNWVGEEAAEKSQTQSDDNCWRLVAQTESLVKDSLR